MSIIIAVLILKYELLPLLKFYLTLVLKRNLL